MLRAVGMTRRQVRRMIRHESIVTALLGAALGIWLDKHHPGKHPWTLALLVVGLAVGCLNAWHWVAKEEKAMRDETKDDDE